MDFKHRSEAINKMLHFAFEKWEVFAVNAVHSYVNVECECEHRPIAHLIPIHRINW